MKPKSIFFIFIAAVSMLSCGNSQKPEKMLNEEDHLIVISHRQFQTDKMAFGELQKMPFTEIVKCNGNVVTKSGGIAKISPAVSGLVQKILCTAGQQVYMDQVLFELSGNEFIELQKDFAGVASQLRKMKSEYERINALYKENIGSEKELIAVESEYKSIQAMYKALEMKLQLIGLDASKIEDAEFYRSFSIKSPINGFISQINVSLGQHADQQTIMAEIIDVKQLQLKVAVFEKDINRLIPGQKLKFKLSDNSNTAYDASLIAIGRTVDPVSKTVQCYAGIDDLNSANFVNNAYAEVEIITKTETENSVPEESVIKSDGVNYLLAYVKDDNNNYYLKNIRIEVGRSNNGYIEILKDHNFSKIVTKGVYNIKIE